MRQKNKESHALAEELSALAVLGGLQAPALDALAGAGRVVHLPAQWALVAESQPADSVYLLLTGSAEVRQHGDVIATLGPGAAVGEAALVEQRTRNATVVTTEPVRALRLGFDELPPLFARHPALETGFRAEWDRRAAEV